MKVNSLLGGGCIPTFRATSTAINHLSIIQAAANLNPSLLVLSGTEFLVNKDTLGEESRTPMARLSITRKQYIIDESYVAVAPSV